MTGILLRKLLRDVRLALLIVAGLLLVFQTLWYKITSRILGDLAPYLDRLASFAGQDLQDIQAEIFKGPGQLVRTIIGGERITLDRSMDLLSVGYVHPLIQIILCIWAVGRAAGAIAGELDRGTMELLLAQPLARSRLILAHLAVDLIVIPILCLSLWAGTGLGYLLVGPIEVVENPDLKPPPALLTLELGPFKATLKTALPTLRESAEQRQRRLHIDLASFGPGLLVAGGLLFAMSGFTLWLSSMGRFRWRVLGLAVLITLLMYLTNVLGQMWDALAPVRPLTLFYYYQPQQVILGGGWSVPVLGLPVPMLPVLYGVGLAGYALALRTFVRRDLPAPL